MAPNRVAGPWVGMRWPLRRWQAGVNIGQAPVRPGGEKGDQVARFGRGAKLAISAGALIVAGAVVGPRIAPRNATVVVENRAESAIDVHLGKDVEHAAYAHVDPHSSTTIMVSTPRNDGSPSADWDGSALPVRVRDSQGDHDLGIPADWNPWHTYEVVWCGADGCP